MYRLRIGTRTYMRSTYDRAGGNEGVDASHFLRQDASDFNVTLDVAGPGVLYFVRTNHWHGSPWHYVVDGEDWLVSETSTANPLQPALGSVFMPEAAFPTPLTFTWSVTRGADLNWVPIGFERSFTLAYSRTHYGTGYYIYQLFAPGTSHLSRPHAAFRGEPPDPDVLALLNRAGEDIGSNSAAAETRSGSVDLPARERVEVAILEGRRRLVALKLRLPRAQAIALGRARLQITWDGEAQPSVDAPLALFFGSGSLYNRAAQPWLVKGLLNNIRFSDEQVELASYFPMPFERHARIALIGSDVPATGIGFELRSEPHDDPPSWSAPFHATYRDHGVPELGRDLVLLDTQQTEGGGDYCGAFVGTSFIFSDQAVLWTLEGDPRFFFDDSQSPQAYGTGTEEWAGGGDYWGGQNMTLPLAGHPVGAPDPLSALDPEDLIESAYRVLIADAMPFGKNARIQLEHGGSNDTLEHYQSVVYWYGKRGACLVKTDSLQLGDVEDERAHGYHSPDASEVQQISSRYELGVDQFVPETSDMGRYTRGTSEFSVKLREDNQGVLLRRKLDYAFADQRAEVFVADDRPGATWRSAGVWYLAGSNKCVYSNPPGELDPADGAVQTSNRRFREDEFLIARELSAGRRSLRLRLVWQALPQPLVPGAPPPEQAWSELRYTVYSWVLPP
ncbi:MAG TPA: DUF2961 domain-containing protein [Polyangiales bacterium]|nr:DUF2961 domain-containing protein [Polyangiales bacterium]